MPEEITSILSDVPIMRSSEGDDKADENYYTEKKSDVFEGAPGTAFESVLLMETSNQEIMDNVGSKLTNIARSLGEAQAVANRETFVATREVVSYVVQDPSKLLETLDYLDTVSTMLYIEPSDLADTPVVEALLPPEIPREQMLEATRLLKLGISRDIERHITHPQSEITYSDEQISLLFENSVESSNSQIFENALSGYLKSREQGDEVTHVLYEISRSALNSGSALQIEQALRIASGETSLMQRGSDIQKKYIACALSLNDTALKEAHEVDLFINALAPIYLGQETAKRIRDSDHQLVANNRFLTEAVDTLGNQDPTRLEQIMFFNQHYGVKGIVSLPPGIKESDFPFNLFVFDPGEVSVKTQKLLAKTNTEYRKRGLKVVGIPGRAPRTIDFSPEFREQNLGAFLNELNVLPEGASPEFDPLQTASFIDYLAPLDLKSEQIAKIFEARNTLSREIVTQKERLISQRGFNVAVTMPEMTSLGVDAISMKRAANEEDAKQGALDLQLTLGKYHINAALNEKGQILVDVDEDVFGPAQLIFEYAMLLHVHEVVCSKDESLLKGEPIEIQNQLEQEARRAQHRRQLPAGQRPSVEQMKLASENGWGHLEQVNRQLMLDLLNEKAIKVPNANLMNLYELRQKLDEFHLENEVRLYTFVKETPYSEEELRGMAPIRITSKLGDFTN